MQRTVEVQEVKNEVTNLKIFPKLPMLNEHFFLCITLVSFSPFIFLENKCQTQSLQNVIVGHYRELKIKMLNEVVTNLLI